MDSRYPAPQRRTSDAFLPLMVLALVGIGIIMVYSASYELALKKYGDGLYFFRKQCLFALLGFVALYVCSRLPAGLYRGLAYPLLLGAIGLLAAIHVSPFGYEAGGSSRWLRIGHLTFQPSELARLAMLIYMSYSLAKKQAHVKDLYIGFLPHVLILGVFAALLMIQPDFGSAVIFSILTFILLFVAGVRLHYMR